MTDETNKGLYRQQFGRSKRPIAPPNRIAIDPPVINWQFDQPSERDRLKGFTDIKLVLTGRNVADIKASYENACKQLGWND